MGAMAKKLLFLLLPLFVFFVAWWGLYQTPLAILDMPSLESTVFTDKEIDGGKSEILQIENSPPYKAFRFELKEGFISPYAGISIFQGDHYLDLRPYNEVELEVELKNTKNLELTLATYQDGVTKENEALTFRHNVMEIPILEEVTICRLPLEKVQIAQWWLERFKLRTTELGAPNWEKTKSISFVAKIRLDENRPQQLKIKSIVFKKDLMLFYGISSVLLLCWYTGLGAYFKSSTKHRPHFKRPVYSLAAEHSTQVKEEEKVILNYLSAHYSDPDLTLGQISEALKIPEKTISGSIKKNFQMTFKEYLNGIRLEEAKRLLGMADKNVSEIAYQVGFNSPNHFNRTFKISEGCTPTEFRNQSV